MTDLSKYAEALFALCEEEGILDAVRTDLECVNSALLESKDYARILDTPALSKEQRHRLADETFGSLNEYVVNIVKMLCSSHSFYAFDRLYRVFMKLYNNKLGITEVEAVSAVSLTEAEKERLISALEAKLSSKVVIKNTVDESILGGLILRYNSLQMDGSVKTRLEKIERDLKTVVI